MMRGVVIALAVVIAQLGLFGLLFWHFGPERSLLGVRPGGVALWPGGGDSAASGDLAAQGRGKRPHLRLVLDARRRFDAAIDVDETRRAALKCRADIVRAQAAGQNPSDRGWAA